ncbi:MAG: hypothetical protein ACO1N3_03085 [Gammaproteobacteria bacterium]
MNAIQNINKEKKFIASYTENCEKILPLIQTHLNEFAVIDQTSQDTGLLGLLQKEQAFLQKTDMSAEKKFERYGEMYDELTFVSGLLTNYNNYVEQTLTDSSKPQKKALIASLNGIIKDPQVPLAVKMYSISKIISQPENEAILKQDSWGAKLLAAVKDFFSFLFPRTQTQSEFYKERLLSLKQEGLNVEKNAFESQSTQSAESEQASNLSNT